MRDGPRVGAEVGPLGESQQAARQGWVAVDPDQRLGANEVAGRPKQRMAALDGAHLDSMNALDRPAEDRRIDALNSAAVRAEALRAHDQRQCDRVDAEDQWPFLGDDMKP